MGFPDKLKKLRTTRKLKQNDVALALNMSQQSISLYECNEATPSIEALIQFADYFNVSVDYLIDYKKKPNTSDIEGDELKLIELYDSLPEDKKNISLEILRVLNSASKKDG